MQKLLLSSLLLLSVVATGDLHAQGLHFSQYYNAPMLLSPANTALMPESDYRIGANYRNQWGNVPAPFRTISAYGDFQVFRNANHTNWLGIGGAFFSDRAGNGNLSLIKAQLSAAYHLQLGDYNMVSIGLGAAFVQRSVDFAKLTFDTQWDGFTFDPRQANGEVYSFQKTSYPDITAGVNYAFFPNENVYVKLGVGLLHINQPSESFYKMDNKLGMRPTGNLDMLFKVSDSWIANVSAYYTRQRTASEMVYGATVTYNVTPKQSRPNIFLLGVYHRINDAIIPVVGFEWSNIKATMSMDVTISDLSPATRGNGAIELSLIYQGLYNSGSKGRNAYNCPRF
jgi:type IX secretion system PorP/SprF family membrane protein